MTEQQREIAVGGLYAAANDDGSFGIWKVLAVDGIAVSLRKYSNKFSERPTHVDPNALTIGMDMSAFLAGDDGAAGIGHFPLASEGFWEMEPVLVQVEPVAAAELDGYRIWREGVASASDSSNRPPMGAVVVQKKWWQFWR